MMWRVHWKECKTRFFTAKKIREICAVSLLLVTGNVKGGELVSAEWLSSNGATGDNRLDRWNVTVSFGPEDLLPSYSSWICGYGAGGDGPCYATLRGHACNGVDRSRAFLTPGSSRGTLPRTHHERYKGVYTAIAETCGNPEAKKYGMTSVFMSGFASTIPYTGFTLLSSHGGGGTPIPPIVPEPEPVSCKIDAVKGEFDFGNKNVDELPGIEDGVWGDIRCSGGGRNTASGKLILKNASGGNKVDMKNDDGDVIPVQLIASKQTGSNTLSFVAKDGYFIGHQVWSKILPFEISSYGVFSGSAIIDVTVD
ncbi:hypothetical protein ACX43S_25480 [Enterobacter cloacae]